MVHCGFEATAVEEAFNIRLKALAVALRGISHPGPDGAGYSARPATSGRIRLSGTSSTSSPKSVKPKPAPSISRPRNRARKAACASRRQPNQRRSWRGSRMSERSIGGSVHRSVGSHATSAAGGRLAPRPDRRRPGRHAKTAADGRCATRAAICDSYRRCPHLSLRAWRASAPDCRSAVDPDHIDDFRTRNELRQARRPVRIVAIRDAPSKTERAISQLPGRKPRRQTAGNPEPGSTCRLVRQATSRSASEAFAVAASRKRPNTGTRGDA